MSEPTSQFPTFHSMCMPVGSAAVPGEKVQVALGHASKVANARVVNRRVRLKD